MDVVSTPDTVAHFDELYKKCNIRYADLKKQIADDIIKFTTPLREKILELSADNEYLKKVVKQGVDKARESASKTIKDVRDIIGFRMF